MENCSSPISEDPVLLMEYYLKHLQHQDKLLLRQKFQEVKEYIKELEEINKMLRQKLS